MKANIPPKSMEPSRPFPTMPNPWNKRATISSSHKKKPLFNRCSKRKQQRRYALNDSIIHQFHSKTKTLFRPVHSSVFKTLKKIIVIIIIIIIIKRCSVYSGLCGRTCRRSTSRWRCTGRRCRRLRSWRWSIWTISTPWSPRSDCYNPPNQFIQFIHFIWGLK